jgi:arginine deiminase
VILFPGPSLTICDCVPRAQSDKIFSQQAALGKAQDELQALRGLLEARGAKQAVIEAEIARQVEEYSRLRQQLINQEELQVGSLTGNGVQP